MEVCVIPRPSSVPLDPEIRLSADPRLAGVAAWLRDAISLPLPPGEGGLRLAIDQSQPPDGYALSTAPAGIEIAGGSAAGVFHGAQTFRQLLADGRLPRARIVDAPRFRWRGVML